MHNSSFMNPDDLRARRDILTESKTLIIISRFPGLDMDMDDSGKYRIFHSVDPSFNVEGVPIAELMASAKSVLAALEARYGKGGEHLEEARLSCSILTRPV